MTFCPISTTTAATAVLVYSKKWAWRERDSKWRERQGTDAKK
jgi:hypothetical protein